MEFINWISNTFAEFGHALIAGLIGAMVAYIIATPKKLKERQDELRQEEKIKRKRLDSLEKAVNALLKDRIIANYNQLVAKDSASEFEKRNVHTLFTSYKELHGNGYIDELVETIINLPISKENNNGTSK